ncbi:MAG: sn-glycerol-3-phosphate ABC transporter ATP-binding protein UgpC [Dehalococcoidia bacterium]|nr:sn-glycerol-3-phosphate ABC transporter ATP-binding protein UgpC [Dehalococcoidia bacterium]
MASIVFDNVTKVFGGTTAVNGLSLNIEHGEFLVLVGPSGCGKSTALRLLAGLERMTSGDIYIGERRVNNVAAKDRDLAMVFQSYALYPHMTVRDNIAFGLKMRKLPRQEIERRVLETADLLDIEDLIARKPGQLSGGQRQRVALGRAIVREPAAFLLDEPLSNLDAKLRVQTRAEIAKLHQRLGTTFVYVTHDQVEAMTMASRIAVLDHGVLQQLGTPKEIYDSPTNLFVAGFVGSPSMNFFFDASVAVEDGSTVIEVGPLKLPAPGEDQRWLQEHAGKPVVLGIRPEHIHDPDFVAKGIEPLMMDVEVDTVETMGSETYLHLLLAGQPFIARVDARSTAVAGQQFRAAIDRTKLNLFDAESGLSLRAPSRTATAA